MKKYLLLTLLTFSAITLMTSCDDDSDKGSGSGSTSSESIKVSLSVTGIANNEATINVSLTEGNFYGAKLVEAVNSNTVTVDYTSEIRLISFVEDNGVDIELPYTNTVQNLRDGIQMFTAVIVYDSTGRAVTSSYQLWTAVGDPIGWSEDNSAGDLGEREW